MKKLIFDIETTGLLNCDSIDYSAMPYKIKRSYKTHCVVAKDVDTEEIFTFVQNDVSKFISFIQQYDVIIGHNIINFDLFSLKLTHGLQYEINPNIHKRKNIKEPLNPFPDTLFNKPVRIVDTLVLSKLLNPDRPSGHSLKSWGKRLKNYKGEYGKQEGAWEEFTNEMLEYCIQDVNLTHDVYLTLLKEMGNYTNKWLEAYQLEAAVVDLITRSSHYGFRFDTQKAKECVKDLDEKIKKIEDKVHPQLPIRKLPAGQQPKVPKEIWKKPFNFDKIYTKAGNLSKPVRDYLIKVGIENQEEFIKFAKIPEDLPLHKDLLTKNIINYCKKFDITDINDVFEEALRLTNGGIPNQLVEQMTLANKDDVKQYIIKLGWKPTTWNERDLFLDAKKKKRTKQEVKKAIEKYVKNTIGSEYAPFRCGYLGCTIDTLEETLLNYLNKKRLIVLSTPKYVVDKEKNICKNLLKIKDKVPFIDKIVQWLIYSHRRNNILSVNGTGWLANKRLKVDGHIPTPADTLGAITGRFTHKEVANIPRISTLYGKELRSLFTVDEDHYLITADADGLENRCEGHFCFKYPGGKEYSIKLEAAKPNDFHTLFAKTLGISRNDAKSVKYGLSYGQQPAGLAKNNGWSKHKAKEIYNSFWEEAAPLNMLKTNLELHWQSNGKKFIIGIDGRKLQARAKHVLLNLLFQNAGVTAMKRQHVILDRLLKEEGLLGDLFKDDLSKTPKATLIIAYHDESSQAVHKDLLRFKSFDTKEEAEVCKKELENKGYVLSDINHGIKEICGGKYFIAYSKVITLTSKSIEMAGEYYNFNLKLTQSGQVGKNWSQTH